MKKLLSVTTLLLVLALLITACSKNKETITKKEVSVPLNNCTDVKTNSGIRICYDSLTNDSRCPEGAVCGYAGYVMIKVSFSENGNLHRFKMLCLAGNSQHYNQFGAVSDTSISGYQIKLTDVLPHPKVLGPAPTPDQYKAVFTITH